ncbi:metalloregulator ArsR/SmtB family transcription factor [Gracilinema caldarium]|uniref:ArsR/SmtB family transcription factor n=1 Tax=Gracilinema caldarium TaxID=215591 RepID=UPI0026F2682F|nr:metalloregulator ArsR/SmtB family transcription factor [Gracilinema caldarium]
MKGEDAMTEEEQKRCELRAQMFKALAHPLRIYMLEKIKERPRCVCEMASELGVDKSIVSKYLTQLKNAGILEVKKRGTLVEYHLAAPCVLELASCAESSVLEIRKKRLMI